MNRYKFLVLFLSIIFAGCNSPYSIKRKGYFKIDLPAHQYQLFEKSGYPYTFEYPVYSRVVQDSTFFEEKPENPYWINIDFPQFNGRIYISYKQVGPNKLDKLVNDAFSMTYKHTSKASEISDSLFKTQKGLTGIFFNVGGNAATAQQFFITDSVKHFLRGALYFDATPNADSLAIVNEFLRTDMKHLINTMEWKK